MVKRTDMDINEPRTTNHEPRTTAKPPWIRGKVSWDEASARVKDVVSALGLHSVCVSAACPNKGECWERRHVTFMILGGVCTRGCLFCNVPGGETAAPDNDEPGKVAAAVKELGIRYAVITSVTRDDLADKGAEHFARTTACVKSISPGTLVELLIPDMDGEAALLEKVTFCGADVIGHNIEMPEALYDGIRPKASYDRSLTALKILGGMKERARSVLKSAMIVGLGETEGDIEKTLFDLKTAGVDIVYIGQYLSPTKNHWPVKKYYTPEEFSLLGKKAENMGFKAVLSGPMVRSSYRAYEAFRSVQTLTS